MFGDVLARDFGGRNLEFQSIAQEETMGCYVVKTSKRQIMNKKALTREQVLQIADILGIPGPDRKDMTDVESITIYLPAGYAK